MKILIAVLDWIRWIAGILLAMAIPFAWICRDGLGPDMYESTGFEAIVKTFSSPEIWGLAFAFIVLSAAVRFLSTRGAGEKKVAKWSWRESASVVSVAFLLCLLGVVAFRDWTDRERLRKAEECLASHAAKWNRTVNLPVAPHGEALTAASLPAKSLFAEILIRDEKARCCQFQGRRWKEKASPWKMTRFGMKLLQMSLNVRQGRRDSGEMGSLPL